MMEQANEEGSPRLQFWRNLVKLADRLGDMTADIANNKYNFTEEEMRDIVCRVIAGDDLSDHRFIPILFEAGKREYVNVVAIDEAGLDLIVTEKGRDFVKRESK